MQRRQQMKLITFTSNMHKTFFLALACKMEVVAHHASLSQETSSKSPCDKDKSRDGSIMNCATKI
jgi:hypothetical protein